MKKGDISMNYIIIAAIALVVLIVIILFFTGGMQKLIKGQTSVVEGVVPDWQLKAWTTRCQFACTQVNKDDFCNTLFKTDTDGDGNDDTYYVCNTGKTKATSPSGTLNSLDVKCDEITSC